MAKKKKTWKEIQELANQNKENNNVSSTFSPQKTNYTYTPQTPINPVRQPMSTWDKVQANLGYVGKYSVNELGGALVNTVQGTGYDILNNAKEKTPGIGRALSNTVMSVARLSNPILTMQQTIPESFKTMKETFGKDEKLSEKLVDFVGQTLTNVKSTIPGFDQLMSFSNLGLEVGSKVAGKDKNEVIDQLTEGTRNLSKGYETRRNLLESDTSVGNVTKTTGRVLGQVSRMLPTIGTNIAAPGVGLMQMGQSAMGSTVNERLDQGDTLKQAVNRGNISEATEVGTEQLFGGLHALGGGVAKKLPGVSKVAGLTKPITEKVEKVLGKKLMGTIADVAGESAEEIISDAVQYVVATAKGEDANFNLTTEGETALQTVATTLVLNALTGGMVGLSTAGSKSVVTNSNLDTETKNNLQDFVKDKSITKQGAEALVNGIDNIEDKTEINKLLKEGELQDVVTYVNENQNQGRDTIINESDLNDEEKASLTRVANNMNLTNKQVKSMIENKANLEDSNKRYQTYNESASKFNIDTNNEAVKAIFNVANRRDVGIEYSTTYKDSNGQDIEFTDTENAVHVVEDNGKRTIVINPNAKTDKTLENLIVHEITHDMEGTKEYSKLANLLFDGAKKIKGNQQAYQSIYDSYANFYKNKGINKSSAELTEIARSEFVANTLGDQIGNEEFISYLMDNTEKTTMQKFIDAIGNIINRLTGYKDQERYWREVQDKYKAAYNAKYESRETSQKSSIETQTSNKDSQGRTLTKEQQEYFKDSKVRDDNGNLIPMYHGTNADFNVFDKSKSGSNYKGWSRSGNGFYFTANVEQAKNWGDSARGEGKTNVKEVYLDIKNPFGMYKNYTEELQDLKEKYNLDDFTLKSGYRIIKALQEQGLDTSEVLQEYGFDGIIEDLNNIKKSSDIVVFNPNQIKNVDNTNPTTNPDIRYSINTDDVDTRISKTMTMEQARRMLDLAFKDNNIENWYDGQYKNGDEWLRGEGVDEVETYLDNTTSVLENYLNRIYDTDETYGDEYFTSDILQAYLDNTLTGKENKIENVDLSEDTGFKDDRFYAPQEYKNGKELYDVASQRVTKNNEQEVYKARGEFIINAHDPNYAATIGLSQEEVNKKIKSWANYPKKTMELSNSLNEGVARQNQWAGLENSSIVNQISVSNEDLGKMVKEIKGDSNGWQRKYITSTMLALDTHIDYSDLTFEFDKGYELHKRGANGTYDYHTETIEIGDASTNTVAHEMGHYLDHKWAKDLGLTIPYLTDVGKTEGLTPEQEHFVKNFKAFMEDITASSTMGAEYGGSRDASYWQHRTEILARFIGKFTEWTKNQATNGRYGYEDLHYKDNFTEKQYKDFVKILQEKSKLDTAIKSTANPDIRYSVETKTDNDGNKLTIAQRNYFKGSKAVDENGNLVKVYHTMTDAGKQFNEFNPVGTPYYRFGDQTVNYYTDNLDMSGSYAGNDYLDADTTRYTTIKQLEDKLNNINLINGTKFKLENRNGIYGVYNENETELYNKAKEFYQSLNDKEKEIINNLNNVNFSDLFYEDEYGSKDDNYYNVLNKYKNWVNEMNKLYPYERTYGGVQNINTPQSYLSQGLKEFNPFSGDGTTPRFAYETEEELYKNLISDIMGNNNYQYEGYINLQNPYIVDAKGQDWQHVEFNIPEEYERVIDNISKLNQKELTSKLDDAIQKANEKDSEVNSNYTSYSNSYNKFMQEAGFKKQDLMRGLEEIYKDWMTNIARGEILDLYALDLSSGKATQVLQKIAPYEVEHSQKDLETYNQKYKQDLLKLANENITHDGKSMKIQDFLFGLDHALLDQRTIFRNPNYHFEQALKENLLNGYSDELIKEFAKALKETHSSLKFSERSNTQWATEDIKEGIKDNLSNYNSSVTNNKTELGWFTTNDVVKKVIEMNKKGSNYDGLIMKNVVDYGHDIGKRDPGNLFVTFDSNQFKAADNKNPTENPDIRYSNQTSDKWQEFMDRWHKNTGKGTKLKDAKLPQKQEVKLPVKPKEKTPNFDDLDDVFSEIGEDSVESPLKDRNIETIGKETKTNAYQYENPEVKPYFQEMAKMMGEDLGLASDISNRKTIKGGGVKLNSNTDALNDLHNKYGYSYQQIQTGLNNIIEDKGSENNAVSKKIEFYLDDALRNGYKNIYGKYVEPNQDYINTIKPSIDLNNVEQNKEIKQKETQIPKTSMEEDLEAFREETRLVSEKGKGRKHYKTYGQTDTLSVKDRNQAKRLYDTERYIPISNNKTLETANNRIKNFEGGIDALYKDYNNRISTGEEMTLQDIGTMERMIQIYSEAKDNKKVNELMQNVAVLGTELGQKVQALSIIKRATPEGQLRTLQRLVKRVNAKDNLKIELTNEQVQRILDTNNPKETEKVVTQIAEELGQQTYAKLGDRVRSWRYLSMLGNARTHIRNLTGNVFMNLLQQGKNKVAGGIQDVASIFNPKIKRTSTLKLANEEQRNFARTDAESMQNEIDSNGVIDVEKIFERSKKTSKFAVLNAIENFNSNLLEAEDKIFLKTAYRQAMQNYMAANNLSAKDMDNLKTLNKAREYAIQQAKESTFHQFSSLARELNAIEKLGDAAGLMTGGVVPFKKTPINIAKTGVAYSPLGIARSVGGTIKDITQGKTELDNKLASGNITQEEYNNEISNMVNNRIDQMAKGLSGTAIALLGYALANAGIISGADSEPEDEFDTALGKQELSVRIGDNTYSLDWLAPTAIPLFVGANISKMTEQESHSGLNAAFTSLANIVSPMTEMSMLQGLAQALSSYEQDSSNKLGDLAVSAMTSYAGQYVPTALGQVTKTIDKTVRDTSSSKKGIEGKIDRFVNQQKAKIPGLSQTLPAKVNVWGEEKTRPENVLVRFLENAVVPYNREKIIEDTTSQKLKEVFEETGEKSVLPSGTSKYVTINGERIDLDNEQYNRSKKIYGQTSKKTLDKVIDSKEFNKLDSNMKAKFIKDIYSYAKEEFKDTVGKDKGIEFQHKISNSWKKYDAYKEWESGKISLQELIEKYYTEK